MAKERIRILLVDDHEVVRDGVKSLINANDDLTVVGEAGSVREAIDQAIRTNPEVTKSVLERLRKGKTMRDEKLARLSAQEERILTLVSQGLTNGQIGKQLKLAEKTVKNYVSTILSKLEVARRAEAAAYLARHTTTPGAHS